METSAYVEVDQGRSPSAKRLKFEFNDSCLTIALTGKFKGKYLDSLDAKELVNLLIT